LNPKTKKILSNLLFAALAVGLSWLIIRRIDLQRTLAALQSSDLFWVGLAAASTLLAHFFRSYRWNHLLEPLGYRMNNRRTYYAVLTGYLVNAGTSRGGEVVRCALLAKSEKVPFEILVGTVITERVVDLLMLMLTFSAALLFEFSYLFSYVDRNIWTPVFNTIGWAGIAALAMGGIAGLALLWRWNHKRNLKAEAKEGGLLSRFTGGLRSIFKLQQPFIFLLLSIGIWAGYAFSAWCLMKALPETAHLWITAGLSIVLFSAIGISIPAPAGLGIVFPIAHGIQEVYGIAEPAANNYALLNLAFSNALMIVGGAIAYGLLWWELQRMNNDEPAGI
jgi:hypothetical protein